MMDADNLVVHQTHLKLFINKSSFLNKGTLIGMSISVANGNLKMSDTSKIHKPKQFQLRKQN